MFHSLNQKFRNARICKFELQGDGVADESFGSVGADDGKSSTGGGKLTLKLLLDHGLIEVIFQNRP